MPNGKKPLALANYLAFSRPLHLLIEPFCMINIMIKPDYMSLSLVTTKEPKQQ